MSSQPPTFGDRLAAGVASLVRIVAPNWAEQRFLARARAAAVAEFTGGGFAPLQTDYLTGAVSGHPWRAIPAYASQPPLQSWCAVGYSEVDYDCVLRER